MLSFFFCVIQQAFQFFLIKKGKQASWACFHHYIHIAVSKSKKAFCNAYPYLNDKQQET